MRQPLCIGLTAMILLAGCAGRQVYYKPGLTPEQVRDAHMAVIYSVSTTGPVVRSSRDELRVYLSVMEREGIQKLPESQLPPGVTILAECYTDPITKIRSYTYYAGVPDANNPGVIGGPARVDE